MLKKKQTNLTYSSSTLQFYLFWRTFPSRQSEWSAISLCLFFFKGAEGGMVHMGNTKDLRQWEYFSLLHILNAELLYDKLSYTFVENCECFHNKKLGREADICSTYLCYFASLPSLLLWSPVLKNLVNNSLHIILILCVCMCV